VVGEKRGEARAAEAMGEKSVAERDLFLFFARRRFLEEPEGENCTDPAVIGLPNTTHVRFTTASWPREGDPKKWSTVLITALW
jgi:hypothetical protein